MLGYPAVKAGEALAGGGAIMMVAMPISGMLVSRTDPRRVMAFGFTVTSIALYYMSRHLTLGMDFGTIERLRIYQTMGLAFIFIPSNVLSYVNIPREKNNQISSMINFVRNIGGSVGIALVSTFVTRTTQQRQSYLSANTQNGNPQFRQMADGIAATLRSHGVSPTAAMHQAYARIAVLMQQQAASLAYTDMISTMAIAVICLVPLVFLMKRPPASQGELPPAH